MGGKPNSLGANTVAPGEVSRTVDLRNLGGSSSDRFVGEKNLNGQDAVGDGSLAGVGPN